MNLDCQPHDHKHSIFISFLNDDHFLLSVSEMRVILVAFLSFAFAYAPNLSFLKELFRSLPSSGNISSNSIQYVTVCTILWISDYSILYKKQYRDTQKSDRDAIGVSWSEPSWISKGDATTLKALWHAFRYSNIFQKRRYEPSGALPSSWAQLTSPQFDRMASRLFNFDVPMNL